MRGICILMIWGGNKLRTNKLRNLIKITMFECVGAACQTQVSLIPKLMFLKEDPPYSVTSGVLWGSVQSAKVCLCIVGVWRGVATWGIFFKSQQSLLTVAFSVLKDGFVGAEQETLIDLHSMLVVMLFCLPAPSRFTEWLQSSSLSPGSIICSTSWFGGSIQHLPLSFTVTTRTVTVARWAGDTATDGLYLPGVVVSRTADDPS